MSIHLKTQLLNYHNIIISASLTPSTLCPVNNVTLSLNAFVTLCADSSPDTQAINFFGVKVCVVMSLLSLFVAVVVLSKIPDKIALPIVPQPRIHNVGLVGSNI